MRSVQTLSKILVASVLVMALPAPTLAAGSDMGPNSMGMDVPSPRTRSPAESAKASYDNGVRTIKKADALSAEADNASGNKKDKLTDKARKQYEKAREQFNEAIERVPGLYEAWNYVGYSSRKLGEYEQALAAYDQALKINPNHVAAIEYRAEAYLALNRLDDAKTAYLTLFDAARPLADQLLASMQQWVETKRSNPDSVAAAELDVFAQWVTERADIARQTASLTTDGSSLQSQY